MKSIETEYAQNRFNYFDQNQNKALRKHLFTTFKNGKQKERDEISKVHRTKAIMYLIKIQKQLKYNKNTLYLSIDIFDRYLASVGFWKHAYCQLNYLICAACFIAAKLEEREAPQLDNLILDCRMVTKKDIRKELVLESIQKVL